MFFDLFTLPVDNFVDKRVLTAPDTNKHAGLYKVHKTKAKIKSHKINGLIIYVSDIEFPREKMMLQCTSTNYVNNLKNVSILALTFDQDPRLAIR